MTRVLPVLLAMAAQAPIPQLQEQIERIRSEANLPALAVGVIADGRVAQVEVCGVRKWGDATKATLSDRFHLGSVTKSMTAAVIGRLVDKGKLRWQQTLAESFAGVEMHSGYRSVTLADLLAHRSGMTDATFPEGGDWRRAASDLRALRYEYVQAALKTPPINTPRTENHYSNRNFVIAAVIAERSEGAPWEQLITRELFKPLGIESAGFGAPGTPDKVEQPWPHSWKKDQPSPGPYVDNPPVIGPAGTVHMNIRDFAKFGAFLVSNRPELFSKKTFDFMYAPPASGDYSMGLVYLEREWAGGNAIFHNGSNTLNFAVMWLSPKKRFGVVAATNCGGTVAERALDDVAALVIRELTKGDR